MRVRVETTKGDDSILDQNQLDVILKFKFIDADEYWMHEIGINMIGMNAREFGIPGRRPHEIEHILIKCGGNTWELPGGELDEEGELAPIVVYNGKRSYWAWRLRQKALGVK